MLGLPENRLFVSMDSQFRGFHVERLDSRDSTASQRVGKAGAAGEQVITRCEPAELGYLLELSDGEWSAAERRKEGGMRGLYVRIGPKIGPNPSLSLNHPSESPAG
jgi:hypothetical protein